MTRTRDAGSTMSAGLSYRRLIGDVAGLVALWRDRTRQRRALRRLDDRLLRDIGVGRKEAEIEAHKPFWRP